jgi:hypothetical protein
MGNDATVADAPTGDPQIVKHYHAHIYYDPQSTRKQAARLREQVAAAFPTVTLGRWHDMPVGPHPQSMYQIALASFLPWLMLNRAGLRSCSTQRLAMIMPTIPSTPSGSAKFYRFV